jgi:hypothetical protein
MGPPEYEAGMLTTQSQHYFHPKNRLANVFTKVLGIKYIIIVQNSVNPVLDYANISNKLLLP